MTWHKGKHRKRACECGLRVSQIHQRRHQMGLWHQNYSEMGRLRSLGLSCAEIGRRLRMHRYTVWIYFKRANWRTDD